MPRFSVIVAEVVVTRYAAVVVEAEDTVAAAAILETMRLDGELGDMETPRSASFEVSPLDDANCDPTPTDPQFCTTAAGRAALSQIERREAEISGDSCPVYQ
jgi:hypothetical protein